MGTGKGDFFTFYVFNMFLLLKLRNLINLEIDVLLIFLVLSNKKCVVFKNTPKAKYQTHEHKFTHFYLKSISLVLDY